MVRQLGMQLWVTVVGAAQAAVDIIGPGVQLASCSDCPTSGSNPQQGQSVTLQR